MHFSLRRSDRKLILDEFGFPDLGRNLVWTSAPTKKQSHPVIILELENKKKQNTNIVN